MATPLQPPIVGLSTTFINPTASTLDYPFLGKHGKKLAPGQTYTQLGDPYHAMRYNSEEYEQGLALALANGTLAITATPNPVLQDSATGLVYQLTLSGGTLGVAAPSWGQLSPAIPEILESVPAPNAKSVVATTTIVLEFGEAVTGTTFAVTQNGSTVSGSSAGSSGNKVWTFTPGSSLTADAKVIVNVTGATNGTNTMLPASFTFYVAPIVASIVPANAATGVATSATVAATFANAVTGVGMTVTQASPTVSITGTLTSNTGKTVWTFTPGTALTASKTFTVVVSGATDANGSIMASSTTTFST